MCEFNMMLNVSSDVLPNVKLLLQLFATLPVTSATPEYTFSTLKLLKLYEYEQCTWNIVLKLKKLKIDQIY